MSIDNNKKLAELFMPHATKRSHEVRKNNTKFVHYTSAYAAVQIIKKEEIWMRNALVMNDFMEVQHGQRCLAASWRDDEVGGRLIKVLEKLQTGLSKLVEKKFNARNNDRGLQSFLSSVSEHGSDTSSEDKYGRLSMWRAYGGDTSVALVFNNKPFVAESSALGVYASPVLYRDSDGFKSEFLTMVEGLEEEFLLLEAVGAKRVSEQLEWAFHFAALSTKHPGFAEEREWRVIHSPSMFRYDKIKFTIETIQGVPQKVYKLPFKNYPEEGFVGATLSELLEEIIVGPTENSGLIRESLALILEAKGVPDPWEKVRVSDIPLRR